jgi:hypothetical protein
MKKGPPSVRDARIFRALAVAVVAGQTAAAGAATTTRTGVIDIAATITIGATVPANTVITVEAYAEMSDAGTDSTHTVADYVTLKNWAPGHTAAISIKLPYTWNVTGDGDQVGLSLSVYTNNGAVPSANASVNMPMPTASATTVALSAAI